MDLGIGAYLSVDGVLRPVGTARDGSAVPSLLRGIADYWETHESTYADPEYARDAYFVDCG